MPLSPFYRLEVRAATAFETLTLSPFYRLEVRAACVASELRAADLVTLFYGLEVTNGIYSANNLVALLQATVRFHEMKTA